MLNLNPEDLVLVQKILAEHTPNMIVLAYGSRVDGTSHDGSDLDLVVINPQNDAIPQKNLPALQNALAESNLPILVDLHDWALIPENFKTNIKKHSEVIQKA